MVQFELSRTFLDSARNDCALVISSGVEKRVQGKISEIIYLELVLNGWKLSNQKMFP